MSRKRHQGRGRNAWSGWQRGRRRSFRRLGAECPTRVLFLRSDLPTELGCTRFKVVGEGRGAGLGKRPLERSRLACLVPYRTSTPAMASRHTHSMVSAPQTRCDLARAHGRRRVVRAHHGARTSQLRAGFRQRGFRLNRGAVFEHAPRAVTVKADTGHRDTPRARGMSARLDSLRIMPELDRRLSSPAACEHPKRGMRQANRPRVWH